MPLITSNNLDLVQLVPGQASPETPANDKGGELDSFLTRVQTVSVSAGNATITAADYRRYRKYRVTGNTTAGRQLTLQAISRQVVIDNSDAANTQSIAVKLGTTTLNLAAGKKALYETDGTANGLELIFTNDIGSTLPETTIAQYLANTAGKMLSTDKVWAAADIVALTDAATIAVDMSTFINATVTLAGNRTLGNPSNTKNGQTGVIEIKQDGTGSRTLAYSSNWKFAGGTAPTLTTTASARDLLFYQVISSTVIYATLVKDVK